MKKLIAGNWKMNGTKASASALVQDIAKAVEGAPGLTDICDFVICPPFPYLSMIEWQLQKAPFIALGGQDCSERENGAYTGDASAAMLKDVGCSYVILGHSERRVYHGETDEIVASKAAKAHQNGLITIICVGEKGEEREKGVQNQVVERQIFNSIPPTATPANTVIAYEPVWAIGTGRTATPDDVRDMHGFIREKLWEVRVDYKNMRILYGGSMKPENAAELLETANVDGGLIGGASLKADQFVAIALAAQK